MKIKRCRRWFPGALLLLLGAGGALESNAALYPLETCPLSGGKLGADAVVYDHQGRELRFPSEDCVRAFRKDPEGSLARIDAAIVAQQLPGYPLKTCLVSGEAFGGEMGEPVNRVYRNRLVRFCCGMCAPEFEKDPARFLAKLDPAVIARDKPDYPLATCVVSGEKLGAGGMEPRDYVFAGRLVRFCCPECAKEFGKDPWKHVAKIDAARDEKPGARPRD